MQFKYILPVLIIAMTIGLCSCNKTEFLDAKPNANLNVPATLSDFQALMDNYNLINQTPGMGDMSSDNYYYLSDDWQAQDIVPRNCYIWAPDIFQGNGDNTDWNISYQQVLVANVVLDGLSKMNPSGSDINSYNTVQGEAIFIRANAFFNLAQLFAEPYDSGTAAATPGIPLKLSSDVTQTIQRGSLENTYAQIIADLKLAAALLTTTSPTENINRAIKPAAYGLLSKVFLSMRSYGLAGLYADSCLRLYNTLIDYNTLSPISRVPFTRTNAETIYQAYQVSIYPIDGSNGVAQIDSTLYVSYRPGDLRKDIFFRINGVGKTVLKGTYSGTFALFSGVATNEMYLNRAESAARAGDITGALKDLNDLLSNRYTPETYVPFSSGDPANVLDTILAERRKELPFSNVRWTDLRRLNKEGRTITPVRMLNNQAYTITPNSPLYTLPIPPDEESLSHIQQNIRN